MSNAQEMKAVKTGSPDYEAYFLFQVKKASHLLPAHFYLVLRSSLIFDTI